MIPYGKQNISEEDIAAVADVLRSDFLTQGPAVEKFEREFAEYTEAKYAVAVSNATAALHLSCLALGLKSGDSLWTSPITFVASANCALYCGADPDFIDIDPRTYNIDTLSLSKKLMTAESKGRLPKIVIPVHFSGQPCDMECIYRMSHDYGFKIIEDASHAAGASYKSKKLGSCQFSDVSVFSFHPVKVMTTGEGGMITTNQKEIYEKLIRLRSHGITRNQELMTQNDGGWYYQQIDLGYNYRMTDIQAALGSSQLKRLDEFVRRRNEIAEMYDEGLQELVLTPHTLKETYSAFHLYVINTFKRKELYDYLRTKNIFCQVHYIPVHTQPYYKNLGFKDGNFPNAEKAYSRILSLPMYYGLTDAQVKYIISCIREFFGK